MTIREIQAHSTAQAARARALHAAGIKPADIAREIGTSQWFVYKALKRPDVKPRPKRQKPPGYARERCIEFLGFAVGWYRERRGTV